MYAWCLTNSQVESTAARRQQLVDTVQGLKEVLAAAQEPLQSGVSSCDPVNSVSLPIPPLSSSVPLSLSSSLPVRACARTHAPVALG
jgi:hypothetical protein